MKRSLVADLGQQTQHARSQLGQQLRAAYIRQLQHNLTEFYNDNCSVLEGPITDKNRDGPLQVFLFIHGMGGAPCQIRLVSDSIFGVLPHKRVRIYTTSGDTMSEVRLPFLERYTLDTVEERAQFLDKTINRVVDENPQHDPSSRIGIIVSSNGMLDFLNSWKFLRKQPEMVDKLEIFWVAPMDDHVSEKSSVLVNFLMEKKEKLLPCATDTIAKKRECYMPVGSNYQRFNAELALHFDGERVVYNESTEDYDTVPYLYRKERIESRVFYQLMPNKPGRWFTTVYDTEIYNTIMSAQVEFFRNYSEHRIPLPVCALVAKRDGYWKATEQHMQDILDRYFNQKRMIMSKDTSHVFVINSLIVQEFMPFCYGGGVAPYDQNKVYGKVVVGKGAGS